MEIIEFVSIYHAINGFFDYCDRPTCNLNLSLKAIEMSSFWSIIPLKLPLVPVAEKHHNLQDTKS